MRRFYKFVRFVADTAVDVAIPDFINLPFKIANGIYRCFLAVDPLEQLDMLREAKSLSPSQIDEAIELLLGEWQQRMPDMRITEAVRQAARGIVLSWTNPAPVGNPGEALRIGLTTTFLAGQHQLAQAHLDPGQQAVGRLIVSSGGTVRPASPPTAAPALPGYLMLGLIGQGAFATVYLARYLATNDLRAIKYGKLGDPRRLRREIELVGKVNSPHLVRYYDHGLIGDHFWLAMDYLGERTLAQLIAARPDAEQALLLAEQVLRGLAALHAKGALHRDLKPDNVMVDDQLRLRLIDFGLARPLDEAAAGSLGGLTVAGDLVGTPFYMSPEQARGDRTLTAAADVWSFGVILFEMFAHERPFKATTIMMLGAEILNREVQVGRAEIPAEIRPALARCLARDPAQRYPSAAEALTEFVAHAAQARTRLRHEKYSPAWIKVMEMRLLEQFVAQSQGDAKAFMAFAAAAGAPSLDEERLATILPRVAEAGQGAKQARERVAEKRRWLALNVAGMSSDEIAQVGLEVKALESTAARAEAGVSEAVKQQLATEARTWEQAEQQRRRETEAENRRIAAQEAQERQERQAQEVKDKKATAEKLKSFHGCSVFVWWVAACVMSWNVATWTDNRWYEKNADHQANIRTYQTRMQAYNKSSWFSQLWQSRPNDPEAWRPWAFGTVLVCSVLLIGAVGGAMLNSLFEYWNGQPLYEKED